MVLVAALGGTILTRRSDAPSPPDKRAEAASGALEVFGETYWTYQWFDSDQLYTAVPITLRNRSSSRVVLRRVTVLRTDNLDLRKVEVVGPQSPSLTFDVLKGWPPRPPNPETRLDGFTPETVNGFTIPPGQIPPTTSTTVRLRPGQHQFVVDQSNDASPVFVLRARDPRRTARAIGIKVEFEIDGRPMTRIIDTEFGLCTPHDYDANTCHSDNG